MMPPRICPENKSALFSNYRKACCHGTVALSTRRAMDRRYTRTHEPIHVFSLCYGSAMNRFYKTGLSWFAAPRLSMREHYEAVRRLQRRLATFALLPPRLRSWHTAQSDSGFQRSEEPTSELQSR